MHFTTGQIANTLAWRRTIERASTQGQPITMWQIHKKKSKNTNIVKRNNNSMLKKHPGRPKRLIGVSSLLVDTLETRE